MIIWEERKNHFYHELDMHTSFNIDDKNGINLNLDSLSLWHKLLFNTQQKWDEKAKSVWSRAERGNIVYKQPFSSNIKT